MWDGEGSGTDDEVEVSPLRRAEGGVGGFAHPRRPHNGFAVRHHRKADPRRSAFRNLLPAAGLMLFLFCSPCLGQDVVSITPTRVYLSLAPGEPASVEVTVINQGGNRLLLQPRVLEVVSGEGDSTVLRSSERCLWVEPESEELSLERNSEEDFVFRVQPPPGSPQGKYRFALAFIPEQEKPGGIAFTGGLAVLLELEVLPSPPAAGNSVLAYVLLASGSVLALAMAALAVWRKKRRTRNGATEGRK